MSDPFHRRQAGFTLTELAVVLTIVAILLSSLMWTLQAQTEGRNRDETLRRQFSRAQAQAFPDGMPQERAIGAISLLNRYGPAVVDRLIADLPLDLGQHWVLTI